MAKTTPNSTTTHPRPMNFRDSVSVMIADNYELPSDVYNGTHTYKDRDTNVNRYWSIYKKKYFPIDIASMAKLYDMSEDYIDPKGNNHGKSILVYVKNIDDRKLVDLSWLPYSASTEWDYSDTSYYWVVPRKFFDENISQDPDYYMGGMAICEKADIICGIIGEDADDHYYAYVNTVEMAYDKGLNNYGGAAAYQDGDIMFTGDGSTVGGIKIPNPGN